MTAIRVLVVDDDLTILRLLKRMLSSRKIEVVTATCAEEAFAVLEESVDFVAILCDMHLGTTDGRTFRSEVEKLAPELAERIAFTTGGATSPTMTDFLVHTKQPVFEKPFDFAAMLEFISKRADGEPRDVAPPHTKPRPEWGGSRR